MIYVPAFETRSSQCKLKIVLAMHTCVKAEPFFRHYFHTCETFLFHIPQHGLYSFAYSDNRDDVVLNVIVERSIHVRKSISSYFDHSLLYSN